MIKRKMLHKTLSVLLSLAVIANTISLNALAAEQTQSTVDLPTIKGGEETEEVKVTVSVTENEDNTTTTKKETPEGGFQTDSGLTVDYESSETTKASSTANSEAGDSVSAENADNKDNAENENNASNANNEENVARNTNVGESKTAEVDKLINSKSSYTVSNDDKTYGAEGGSESIVSKGDGSEGDISLGLIEGGKVDSNSEVTGTSGTASTVTKPTTEDGKLKEEDPANFDQTTTTTTERTATGEITSSETKVGDPVTTIKDNGDEIPVDKNDGYHYYYKNAFYDNNSEIGKYIIKYRIVDESTEQNVWSTVNGSNAYNLILEYNNSEDANDPNNGKLLGGLYCLDLSTPAQQGPGYSMVNLEDAVREGYFSVDDAARLRAIMKNGFIREFEEDAVTTYKESAVNDAKLEEFKTQLKSLTSTGLTTDEINNLTWEQAVVATQMAIWTIANRVGTIEVQAESTDSSKADVANKLSEYLLSLRDDTKEKTQIISEERFIDNMELLIGNKALDGVDDQHDIYNVGLKFSLVVTPGKDDDLLVKVVDQYGNILSSAKLPSDSTKTTESGYAKMVTGADGKTYYILDNMQLSENADIKFTLKIEGIQNLEKGVYVFQSRCDEDGKSTSQNMIKVFEGQTTIDLGTTITMRFNVEEADITTTREWRKEWTKEVEYPVVPLDDDFEIKEDQDKEEDTKIEEKEEKNTSTDTNTESSKNGQMQKNETIQTSIVSQNSTAPKTGDGMDQMFVWISLILLSGVAICQFIAARRKF